jgi:thioredoxin:protein disulfide reductase
MSGTTSRRRRVLRAGLVLACLWGAGLAAAQSPFAVDAALERAADGGVQVTLTLGIPAEHYLYAEAFRVEAPAGGALTPLKTPRPVRKFDPYLEQEVGVYDTDAVFTYAVAPPAPDPLELRVALQGCSASICFLPEERTITLRQADAPAQGVPAAGAGVAAEAHFTVAGRASGYLSPEDFLAFLDAAEAGAGATDPAAALESRGVWATLFLILLGGLALNLTPCVLPMIPVNIAIIGAGAQAGSRRRGFALGGTYGTGIALVYGILGLVVVLTGATFGTLNASPWFNLGIAVLFAVLALAMFDVFRIDFSRFQGRIGPQTGGRRGGFPAAFVMGGVAALLAGACVAPVVISVLVLSADWYARGRAAGLLLPFLLGVGMALPWPFAGAGLSFLPKPGRWMERVKIAFGVIIILFAAWYGVLGVRLLHDRRASGRAAVAEAQQQAAAEHGWRTALPAALAEAKRSGQPVLIDFWATWCKNCLQMEKTTFKDPAVTARLERYVKVKFQAERPGDPEIKAVLERYGVLGLPTYVVLHPENGARPGRGETDT